MASFTTQGCLLHLDLHTQQVNLLPTSTEGLSIPPALPFTKDQTQEIMIVIIATESKSSKIKLGVNNGGNIDRDPMMFTSDVSLPKDDTIAKLGEQITAG